MSEESVLTAPAEGMTRTATSGLAWTAAAQLARQFLQTLSLVVLSRLLAPEAFGLLAEVTVVSGLLTLVADLGMTSVITQRPHFEEHELSTLFWVQMLAGSAAGVALASGASSLAGFYGQPELRGVTIAIAVLIPLTGSSSIHRALMMRELRFRAAAVTETASAGFGVLTAVALAALGAGVWSLVGQLLVYAVVRLATAWKLQPFVPALRFRWQAARRTTSLGVAVVGAGIANYLYRNVDNLTVGKILGAEALGIYVRGYNVLLIPSNQIQGVIGRVLGPLMARVQSDPARLRSAFLKSSGLLALLGFPTMTLIAVTAPLFVDTVFGPGWEEAIPVVRAMALTSLVHLLLGTSGAVYLATERVRLQLVVTIVGGSLVYVGVGIGLAVGTVEAVAVGYAVASAVLALPLLHLPARLAGSSFLELVRVSVPAAVASAALAAAVLVVDPLLGDLPEPFRLAVEAGVGGLVYVALVAALRAEGTPEAADAIRRVKAKLVRSR